MWTIECAEISAKSFRDYQADNGLLLMCANSLSLYILLENFQNFTAFREVRLASITTSLMLPLIGVCYWSRGTTSLQMLSFAVVYYTRVIPRGVFYRGSRSARKRNEEPFVSAASSGGSANVRAKWLKPDL